MVREVSTTLHCDGDGAHEGEVKHYRVEVRDGAVRRWSVDLCEAHYRELSLPEAEQLHTTRRLRQARWESDLRDE